MEQADEDLGWIKDEDIYGNEIYRPNLKQAALFMELICSGTMPQLEWRSPGRHPMAPPRAHAHLNFHAGAGVMQRKLNTYATHMPNLQKEPQMHTPGPPQMPKISPSPKSINTQLSPFDFDDTDKLDASLAHTARSQSASPLKTEPRKRVVGSLSNALNMSPNEKPNLSTDYIPAGVATDTPVEGNGGPPIFTQPSPPKPPSHMSAVDMPLMGATEAALTFPVTSALESTSSVGK